MTQTTTDPTLRPASSLRGARVAFVGALASLALRAAQRAAVLAGAEVSAVVTRRTSLLVVGEHGLPLARDGAVLDKLRRADELNSGVPTIRVISEREYLALIGAAERGARLQRCDSLDALVHRLGSTHANVRTWIRLGLLRETAAGVSIQEVAALLDLAALLVRRVSLTTIVASLRRLAALRSDTDRVLEQLQRLSSAPAAVQAELGACDTGVDGQLSFRFDDTDDERPTILRLEDARRGAAGGTPQRSGHEWFALGQALEEEGRGTEACEAYRRAIGAGEVFPEACFNLGTLLQAAGKPEAAVEFYRLAVIQRPALASAWYNLADVQESQGDLRAAIESLEHAIRVQEHYADAHYNLALCCERAGRADDAKRHWEAYLRLDPASEWAQVARQRLALLQSI